MSDTKSHYVVQECPCNSILFTGKSGTVRCAGCGTIPDNIPEDTNFPLTLDVERGEERVLRFRLIGPQD